MLSAGFLIVSVAFVTTWISTALLIRLLIRYKILDYPNARSSHSAPLPRGGGLGIVLGVFLSGGAAYWIGWPFASSPVLAGSLLVAVSGAVDDVVGGVRPLLRLLLQTVAAGWVIVNSGGLTALPFPPPLDSDLGVWGLFVAVLWIVAVCNFFNFLDGIDGYAGAQTLLAGMGLLLLGHEQFIAIGLALIGTSAAFLLFNWHPAKIFMGDVGSGTLGFLFGALPFTLPQAARETAVFATGIFLWFFLSDGLFTLLVRLARGQRLWSPHRSHLYQRLVITGLPHDTVVLRVSGATTLLIGLAILSCRSEDQAFQWATLSVATMLFLSFLYWTHLRESRAASLQPFTERRFVRRHRASFAQRATRSGAVIVLAAFLGTVVPHSGLENAISAGNGNSFYVSPSGDPQSTGTFDDPWDLATALSHPSPVVPGDTIWLRGGTYTGVFESVLRGEPDRPIVVRQYRDERVTIDTGTAASGAGLLVDGEDCWYWGIEIMSSNPNRKSSQKGSEPHDLERVAAVVVRGPRTRFINMIIHDSAGGYGFWSPAEDSEIYGNLIYYNGWSAPDRGHGHAIYAQNRQGRKRIEDNIAFSGFGMGIRAYGSEKAFARNIEFVGNISFNSGVLSGHPPVRGANFLVTAGSGAENILFQSNHSYHRPTDNRGESSLGWVFSGEERTLVAHDNYWIGGSPAVEVWNWDKVTFERNVALSDSELVLNLNHLGFQSRERYHWDRNRYLGSDLLRLNGKNARWSQWRSITGLDAHSVYEPGRPKGTWIFLRPNKYDPGRAHLIVYNWDLLDQVSVRLDQFLKKGTAFEIRDAQNFFGKPVASALYDGQPVLLPMKGLTTAMPIGLPAPEHTAPEFAVFVIIPVLRLADSEGVSKVQFVPRAEKRMGMQ